MTDTTNSNKAKTKNQILRRLNVVFREHGLPQMSETNKAIRQAENNFWIIGEKFHAACNRATDIEQIEKDDALLKKYGF